MRELALPARFEVPTAWGRRYEKDAKPIPACADFKTIDEAKSLMSKFLDPVLRNEVTGMTWNPELREWQA